MLDSAHHNGGFGQPFTAVRRVVPWLLLGLLLVQVFGMVSTWQVNRRAWVAEQNKPKPSQAAAAAAAAGKKDEPKKDAPKTAAAAAPSIKPTSKVLVVSDVTLRRDPSTSADALRDLKTGERLELIGKVGNWYKVKDGSSRIGWVSASEKYTKTVDK